MMGCRRGVSGSGMRIPLQIRIMVRRASPPPFPRSTGCRVLASLSKLTRRVEDGPPCLVVYGASFRFYACIGTTNPIGQFHVAYATRICPSALYGSWKVVRRHHPNFTVTELHGK